MSTKRTIEFKGVEIQVEYTYDKGHPGVMYYSDMSGQPPEPESAEIHRIWIQKSMTTTIELFDLLEDQLEEIEQTIIDLHHEE